MLHHDQRRTQRFELRLPIELVRMGSERLDRVTETRNLSSGGVLFLCESQLPVGEPIEYRITLPTGAQVARKVTLHCVGTVIRLEARPKRAPKQREIPFNVAATLDRYEFVRSNA